MKTILTLVYQEWTTEWVCVYQMMWYPFDQQTCHMDLVILTDFVVLVPGILKYSGPKDLPSYYVKDFTMVAAQIRDKEGVQVVVNLGRRTMNIIMTVFLPTILLNIIGHSTLYYKQPAFFNTAICVNMTIILSLLTLFISVSRTLPTTSYVKMIDVWLIFSLSIPFAEVLLTAYKVMWSLCENKARWLLD